MGFPCSHVPEDLTALVVLRLNAQLGHLEQENVHSLKLTVVNCAHRVMTAQREHQIITSIPAHKVLIANKPLPWEPWMV
jgi:hypothetical protein